MVGERDAALKYLSRAAAVEPDARDLPRNAAIVYAQFGDRDQSLQALQKYLASGGTPANIRSWPNFDGLKDDPRYQQLLKSAEAVQAH